MQVVLHDIDYARKRMDPSWTGNQDHTYPPNPGGGNKNLHRMDNFLTKCIDKGQRVKKEKVKYRKTTTDRIASFKCLSCDVAAGETLGHDNDCFIWAFVQHLHEYHLLSLTRLCDPVQRVTH